MNLLGKVYYKRKEKELNKALKVLNKVDVDNIFYILSNNCWYSKLNYKVILKDRSTFEIIVKGKQKYVLIKYHKKDIIKDRDIYSILVKDEIYNPDKIIYITTGKFSDKVFRLKKELGLKKIILEDGRNYIRKQHWINVPLENKINIKQLNFYEYIPN